MVLFFNMFCSSGSCSNEYYQSSKCIFSSKGRIIFFAKEFARD
jgi:hypothetical protein